MTELATKTCAHCGSEFTTHKKGVICCSSSCGAARNRARQRTGIECEKMCVICGLPFVTKVRNQICCSWQCSRVNAKNIRQSGRFIILERDNFQCIYCGASPRHDGASLQVDHVYPESQGGDSTAANLVTACEDCNGQKQGRILQPQVQTEILATVERRNRERGIAPQLVVRAQLAALIAEKAG